MIAQKLSETVQKQTHVLNNMSVWNLGFCLVVSALTALLATVPIVYAIAHK